MFTCRLSSSCRHNCPLTGLSYSTRFLHCTSPDFAGKRPGRPRKKFPVKQDGQNDSLPSSDLGALLSSALSTPKTKGDKARINILSAEVCDDILDRLGPTIERHVGCDIIDVNPGVGLWSSKLHERLQPRSHILMEPDEKLYLPFLRPLLDRHESRYKHVPWSGHDWDSYKRLASEGLLPNQEPLSRDDPRLDQRNDSLLFIANFASHPSRGSMGFGSAAAQMFYQLMSAVRTHSLFHSYGFVRMLIWTMDREKTTILPRTVAERRRSTVETESASDSVVEVTGTDKSTGIARRERSIDLQSAIRVLKDMQENRIQTPVNRLSQLQKDAEAALDSGINLSAGFEEDVPNVEYSWYKELSDLEKQFAEGKLHRFEHETSSQADVTRKRLDKSGRTIRTKEWIRLTSLRSWKRVAGRKALKVNELIDLTHRISDMALQLVNKAGPWTGILKGELTKLQKKHAELYHSLDPDARARAQHTFDDREAFHSKQGPLLTHDHRPYHPLILSPNEFSHQAHLPCLIDVQPGSVHPALKQNPKLNHTYDSIVKWLFLRRSQPFVKEIESLAPGAVEALVPKVPQLHARLARDNAIAQTGNHDYLEDNTALTLSQLRVRMLTHEMIEELVAAWDSWLFKPTPTELYMKVDAKFDDSSYTDTRFGSDMVDGED